MARPDRHVDRRRAADRHLRGRRHRRARRRALPLPTFLKLAFPMMLLSLLVGTGYVYLRYLG